MAQRKSDDYWRGVGITLLVIVGLLAAGYVALILTGATFGD